MLSLITIRIAMKMSAFAIVALGVGSNAALLERAVPLPTQIQVNYQRQELVALTHFNMATFFRDGDPACDASNWAESQKPSSFAPTKLNISNWIESYKAVGVKSGILTAKHGCGFLLWPTNVTLPNGKNYGYHIGGEGGLGIDIPRMFADEMAKAGLPHSFYYSLKDSFYLNAIGDNVRPAGTLIEGQINVTQEQFEDISVAAVTELWSQYGNLAEIWFDGGISDRIKSRITGLLKKLQPNAIAMGAGIENDPNEVDWVGTESGMPKYPVWSTGCNAPGAGGTGESPKTATNFCPKCGDCTLQSPDTWFWEPGKPIKSLSTLIDMYHGTVGNNAVMELDFAIDRTGNIDPNHAQRYKEFGDWIKNCYGTAVASSTWQLGSSITLSFKGTIDRVAIMEDIAMGQRVTGFTLEVGNSKNNSWQTAETGSAIGHKRIVLLNGHFTDTVKLTITDGVSLPANLSMAVFSPCPSE